MLAGWLAAWLAGGLLACWLAGLAELAAWLALHYDSNEV